MEARTEPRTKTLLWAGAVVTASAAVFFPRIQGIREDGDSWWRLAWFFVPQDMEGVILVPLVVLLTIALFALVGRWAWKNTGAANRPAKVGLIVGLLGLLGALVFFLSAPGSASHSALKASGGGKQTAAASSQRQRSS